MPSEQKNAITQSIGFFTMSSKKGFRGRDESILFLRVGPGDRLGRGQKRDRRGPVPDFSEQGFFNGSFQGAEHVQ